MDDSVTGLPLEKLKMMAQIAQENTQEARAKAERDRDYYDGHQWTDADAEVLRRRKQPVITTNRVQRKVDAMVGIENRARVDPRAFARNPQDERTADVATKALVYVDDLTRFDAKRSAAFENLLVEGYGGVEIIAAEKRGRIEVVVNRVRWEEILYDPHSREKDFSDATYIGLIKWMSIDQAVTLYSQSYTGEDPLEEVLEQTLSIDTGDTYDDRPSTAQFRWADKRQKRVRVAQIYYQQRGEWRSAVFTGGAILMEGVSPYLDEDGRPACPIILMTAYIDRENRRYGVVRSLISMQDEINKRRSKLLHLLNSRQTIGVKGAVPSVDKMKQELAKPDGHVEVDVEAYDYRETGIKPFEIVPTTDMAAGQLQLLQESKAEIDGLGPDASLIGQMQGEQSGRAIMAQQQAGMASVAPVYDSLRDFTLRCYRAMWCRVRQFWTEERWIRITDEVEAPQYVAVNQVVGVQPVQTVDPTTGMPTIIMQTVVENRLAELDVDIIIDEAPDVTVLRQEQFEQLSQMVQAGMPVPPEIIIEASNLRDKPRLLEMLKASQQQAAQAQQQQAAQQAKLADAEVQIKGVAAEAKAERDRAAAAVDIASIPKIQVETRRAALEPIAPPPGAMIGRNGPPPG